MYQGNPAISPKRTPMLPYGSGGFGLSVGLGNIPRMCWWPELMRTCVGCFVGQIEIQLGTSSEPSHVHHR